MRDMLIERAGKWKEIGRAHSYSNKISKPKFINPENIVLKQIVLGLYCFTTKCCNLGNIQRKNFWLWVLEAAKTTVKMTEGLMSNRMAST
jgi:hypothetical protein